MCVYYLIFYRHHPDRLRLTAAKVSCNERPWTVYTSIAHTFFYYKKNRAPTRQRPPAKTCQVWAYQLVSSLRQTRIVPLASSSAQLSSGSIVVSTAATRSVYISRVH